MKRKTPKRSRALGLLGSAVLCGMAAVVLASAGQPGRTSIVQLAEGPVRGISREGVDAFLGIPFAAPPLGDLRWRPPAPPAAWRAVRDAVAFGGSCVQTNTLGVFAAPSDTEDCLYLNVFAPAGTARSAQKKTALRPVMVWIHGGGLFDGSSREYDGGRLARAGDVVVVTLNYRLNVFGFLAHPALEAEGHASVNYGLLDQQAALRWVQRNIRAFGGDPDRVTLFGESAGATAVLFQLISPAGAGLFQRAIAQSPAYQPSQATLADAQASGLRFASAIGCTATEPELAAACMRSRSVREILASAASFVASGPVRALDGTVLPLPMGEAFASGRFQRVPVLVGSNLDEQTWFLGTSELTSGAALAAADYPAQLGGGANAALIQAQYPLGDYPNPSEALAAARTDSGFACGTRRGIRLLAQHVPTWAYEFRDRTAPAYFPPVSFAYGAAHTTELAYLFENFRGASGVARPLRRAQRRLADDMVSYWTAFARSGDPNSKRTPDWARYQPERDNYQALQLPRPAPALDFAALHKCDFWDHLP